MKLSQFPEFSLRNYSGQLAGIILMVVMFISCHKAEKIPSYIHIDKIDVTTIYADQGSNSSKIVDAWIYVDGASAGTYELPCTIPVLFAGTHTVTIAPGVKENGISDTRTPYVFYNNYQETVTLTSGQITTIAPTTAYSQSADFSWLEDFDGSGHSICNSHEVPDTVMKISSTPGDAFELPGSGVVVLDAAQTSYFGISCNKFELPQDGAAVFLELNYKCNTDFNVGVVGYDASGIAQTQNVSLTLRPSAEWNKVYINMTSQVSGASSSVKFGIYFSMLKNPGFSTSYFYLDNVKLIN
jgi:hypothetical protein